MFSGLLQKAFGEIVIRGMEKGSDIHYSVLFFLFTSATYLMWQIWTFTIVPAWSPQRPKLLPYYIPVLGQRSYLQDNSMLTTIICEGQAISFFRDSHGTLTRAREYFGNNREPFAITVAGATLYIITSPQDAAAAYKNTTSLTFDDYTRDMMVAFGGSPAAVEKMWRVPGVNSPLTVNPNPAHKRLAHLSEDFYRQQLHPGKNLEDVQGKFLHVINVSLTWERISEKAIISSKHTMKTVSLLAWCQNVLLDAATRSFFGDRLLDIQPDLFDKFFDFDDNSWQLTYKLPKFLCKDMYLAKNAGIEALRKYFTLPKGERTGESWLIRNLELEMRNVGITEADIAAFVMMIYWVINGNAYKLCFWVLAYALYDQKVLDTLRNEVAPAVRGDEVNLDYLSNKCPYFDAVYNEVLRITASSSSVRTVTVPTLIHGKLLSPGKVVLIPCRQLHFDERYFGRDALQFRPERFLEDKDLSRSTSFKPFGGGTTYCPGRFLAKREVFTFVALFLCRFEVELGPPEDELATKPWSLPPFPKIEEMKPCLGIMGPAKNEDVKIYVRPRVEE